MKYKVHTWETHRFECECGHVQEMFKVELLEQVQCIVCKAIGQRKPIKEL